MNDINPKVDEYLSNAKKWENELEKLRKILLECGLTEELKWKQPCYSFQKSNVIIIGEFKEFCVLSFFKGVLLKDCHKLLVKQGKNTQSARIIKFTNVNEIVKLEAILKAYIFEAIEIEKVGLEVTFKKKPETIPEELQHKFNEIPSFKTAFNKLTPGRQRGYILFFSQPKQYKTRMVRIEKNMKKIIDGKGLNDCCCGLSRKMPNCDVSHKNIN